MPLTEQQWSLVARDLHRALAQVAPAWAERPATDPGSTLLEVLAWLTDELQHRRAPLEPQAQALVRRLSRIAAELAVPPPIAGRPGPVPAPAPAPAAEPCDGAGLQRVHYFAGRLLSADDLRAEQTYLLERLARRNRWQFGTGVVGGLAVTLDPAADGEVEAGAALTISPGLAIDPQGREIGLDAPHRVALPAPASMAEEAALLLVLHHAERPCGSVPSVGGSEPACIVEGFEAALVASADENAVVLARVQVVQGVWQLQADG